MKNDPSKRDHRGEEEYFFNFELDEIELQEDMAEKDLNEFTVPLTIGNEKIYPVKDWEQEKGGEDEWDDFILWNSELN